MRMVGIVMPNQISRIGTDSSFEEIIRGTIFAGTTVNDTCDGFTLRLNEIASRAGGMLAVIDSDISENQNAIKFMSLQELNLLEIESCQGVLSNFYIPAQKDAAPRLVRRPS